MSSGTGKPGEVGLTGFVREGLPVPVFGGSQWEKQPSLLRSPGRKHRSRAEQAGPRPQREAEPEGESASQPGRRVGEWNGGGGRLLLSDSSFFLSLLRIALATAPDQLKLDWSTRSPSWVFGPISRLWCRTKWGRLQNMCWTEPPGGAAEDCSLIPVFPGSEPVYGFFFNYYTGLCYLVYALFQVSSNQNQDLCSRQGAVHKC